MSNFLFKVRPLAVAISVAPVPAISLAQQAEEPLKLQDLPTIVVTAQGGDSSNGIMLKTDPKQPIQPVPASDGGAYLESIMGFNNIQNGGSNGDVTFRGMFGSRIKMISNGTETLGACPARMDAPTSYISPESYDDITIVKGPQTVLYPTPGSAATVIFSRNPPQLEDKNYQGQASVVVGSFGRLDHNVDATVGNEKMYARLNANRSVSDNYDDGDGNTVHSNWERWSTDLSLGLTPDEDTWLELKFGAGDGESAYAGRSMDGSQFKRESIAVRAEKRNLSEHIKKLEAQVDYSFNDHIMDNYSLRENTAMRASMDLTRRTVNSRVAMTTEWDKFSLVTGADSQHWKHAGNMVMTSANGNTIMNKPMMKNMDFQSYGLFGELSYNLNSNNRIIAGVRGDHVEYESFQTNIISNPDTRSNTSPSGFVRLENINPELGMENYVGIGYVERNPDFWELFSTSLAATTPTELTINNMDALKTEKTLQLDFGTQVESGNWSAWASAYAGLVDDFILMKYDTPSVSQSYPSVRNVDATIAGAEAGIGYHFSDHIEADLSTMYAWGENTTDNTALPQIAPLEGRLNLRYVGADYSLGLLWRAVAKQSRTSLYEGNVVGYDMGETKAFNTLSLNASYNVLDDMEVSVGVDNVLDETYKEHLNKAGANALGYAADTQFNDYGRNYWARISMKF